MIDREKIAKEFENAQYFGKVLSSFVRIRERMIRNDLNFEEGIENFLKDEPEAKEYVDKLKDKNLISSFYKLLENNYIFEENLYNPNFTVKVLNGAKEQEQKGRSFRNKFAHGEIQYSINENAFIDSSGNVKIVGVILKLANLNNIAELRQRNKLFKFYGTIQNEYLDARYSDLVKGSALLTEIMFKNPKMKWSELKKKFLDELDKQNAGNEENKNVHEFFESNDSIHAFDLITYSSFVFSSPKYKERYNYSGKIFLNGVGNRDWDVVTDDIRNAVIHGRYEITEMIVNEKDENGNTISVRKPIVVFNGLTDQGRYDKAEYDEEIKNIGLEREKIKVDTVQLFIDIAKKVLELTGSKELKRFLKQPKSKIEELLVEDMAKNPNLSSHINLGHSNQLREYFAKKFGITVFDNKKSYLAKRFKEEVVKIVGKYDKERKELKREKFLESLEKEKTHRETIDQKTEMILWLSLDEFEKLCDIMRDLDVENVVEDEVESE